MRSLLIFILSFISIAGWGQDTLAWEKDSDTGRTSVFLSAFEKDVLKELNMARTNPARYAQLYIKPTIAEYTGVYNTRRNIQTAEGAAAVKECVRELQNTKTAGLLRPDEDYYKTASSHTSAQSRTRQVGHTSPNGKTFADRVRKLRPIISGECISYGETTPRGVVTSLLIDDNVPDRGHRKNILNGQFNVAGVSAGSHKVYRTMCTIDFAKIVVH